MNPLKLYIDLPFSHRAAIIHSRDNVANLLTAAMRKYGYQPPDNQPARWGFGVIAKPANPGSHNPKQARLHLVQRVIVGTSDPDLATILSQLQPNDLLEPNQVAGAGLDLRMSTISRAPSWIETEAAAFYCVSPVRVTQPSPHGEDPKEYLQTGDTFNQLLNRTMQTRFGRIFDLTLIPDSLYVKSRHGDIKARMAIKMTTDKKTAETVPLTVSGLVLPFILTGAPEDLRDAWYSGLGRSTARGFGCLEVQQ
ncbi:MAG: hypothetical protein BWK78_05150 [Thiotrichaceae bacterium IS1]|nr:MAG: hypothetical protein BWK78_05150 [Thiotrichaceae bacterium IS1]